MQDTQRLNVKVVERYRLYAKFYPIVALLVYWIVWRGKILRHVRFFRGILSYRPERILDIATGDGSLTDLALFKGSQKAAQVTCIDISPNMNAKAAKKLKARPVEILLGDVQNLPFANNSWKFVTCFGGLNSFANPLQSLKELRRIITADGVLRGSVLLKPEATWRQRLIARWIEDGYQTISPSLQDMENLFRLAGFRSAMIERHGHVLLFELRPA